MDQKLICPECGRRNRAEARFCKYCGAPIGRPKARRMLPAIPLILALITGLIGFYVYTQMFKALPLVKLVPEDANLVAGAQIEEILEDPHLRRTYDKAPKPPDMPKTAEEGLSLLERETGVDLRDFSQAILFGDLSREEYFGVIAEGAFDREELIEATEARSAVC